MDAKRGRFLQKSFLTPSNLIKLEKLERKIELKKKKITLLKSQCQPTYPYMNWLQITSVSDPKSVRKNPKNFFRFRILEQRSQHKIVNQHYEFTNTSSKFGIKNID